MEELKILLSEYRLIVLLSGLVASLVCGALKIPISTYIKLKKLSEKEASQRLTVVCTVITAVVSAVCVVFFRCYEAHSISPLGSVDVYLEVMSAVMSARMFYALYEGAGPVSIKKWIHLLITKIFPKKDADLLESALGTALVTTDAVQDILENEIHLPLTDDQKRQLVDGLKSRDGAGK